ncbi:TPA: AIDA repeat-containing protein, partial [Escherichia coli]|nr:AIDA repeat-containing protein [Escherichia coli]
YQYVHNGGTASDTVVNSDGWQIVKNGGVAGNTTVTPSTGTVMRAGICAVKMLIVQKSPCMPPC